MITVLPKCISTKQLPFLPGEGSPGKAGSACGAQPAPLGSSVADAQEGSRDGVCPSSSEVRATERAAQEGGREGDASFAGGAHRLSPPPCFYFYHLHLLLLFL